MIIIIMIIIIIIIDYDIIFTLYMWSCIYYYLCKTLWRWAKAETNGHTWWHAHDTHAYIHTLIHNTLYVHIECKIYREKELTETHDIARVLHTHTYSREISKFLINCSMTITLFNENRKLHGASKERKKERKKYIYTFVTDTSQNKTIVDFIRWSRAN